MGLRPYRFGQCGTHEPTQPLTSQNRARGVSIRSRHGRHISIFDCHLRAHTGALARGYNPVCAFRNFHPGRTTTSFVTPDDSASEPDAKFAAEEIIRKL